MTDTTCDNISDKKRIYLVCKGPKSGTAWRGGPVVEVGCNGSSRESSKNEQKTPITLRHIAGNAMNKAKPFFSVGMLLLTWVAGFPKSFLK